MRKILVSLIALSLIATAPLASGAVKAGDSCKKIGQTSTTQGKKYTCIKSGKKLIWNKGDIISAAVPMPAPSASPTPTPSATPVVVEIKAGQNCQTPGELSKNSNGPLECREIANNNRLWTQLSNNPTGAKNSIASEDVKICKLPDLRTQKTPGQGAAFPLTEIGFSSIGTARVAIIPIDFSDAPGDSNLSQIIETNKNKVDSWLTFNSQGKQTYTWNIINEWLRAPKSSDQYNYQNPGNPRGIQTQSDSEIYSQLFKTIGTRIDLSKIDFAFLLFPTNQKGIQVEVAGRSRQVNTSQGIATLSFFGAGAYFVETKQEVWRIWVHEIMHSTGLAMHAPGNGSPLHIGGNQTGASSVLSGWDKFVSGWIDDSQVYCLQAANVSNQKITLASADKSDSGYKLGIIKITQSTAIVVESRRRGVFSEGFPVGTYGLNAYVVQTAQDNERCDGCNQDDIEKKQFAYYLRAEGVDRGMFNFPMAPPTRWSIFVRQGESVTFSGVKVTLESTGDYDTISITK